MDVIRRFLAWRRRVRSRTYKIAHPVRAEHQRMQAEAIADALQRRRRDIQGR